MVTWFWYVNNGTFCRVVKFKAVDCFMKLLKTKSHPSIAATANVQLLCGSFCEF